VVDRYYDTATEQFLSIDPDVAETGEPYAYTGDDPLNAADPLGLSTALNPWRWRYKSLPRIEDRDLRKILERMFQPGDRLPGGTAGALREEALTGKPVGSSFHDVEGPKIANQLRDVIQSGDLQSRSDRLVARAAYDDLWEAQSDWDTAAAGGKFDAAAATGEAKMSWGRVASADTTFDGNLFPRSPDMNPTDPGWRSTGSSSTDGGDPAEPFIPD
jgi:hypothetical protein